MQCTNQVTKPHLHVEITGIKPGACDVLMIMHFKTQQGGCVELKVMFSC